MSTPQIYRITELAGAWIAGYRRPNTATITLTPEQAEYDVQVGALVPVGVVPADPVPPPLVLQDGDYLHFRHAGLDRYAAISELEDFLKRDGGALAEKQPLDDGLSAIAALTTTLFGRSLLTLASRAAVKVTPAGGAPTTLGAILAALDPTARGFQAAQSRLYAVWATGLPVYSGSGPAPVPAGQPFMNNGTPQIAQ